MLLPNTPRPPLHRSILLHDGPRRRARRHRKAAAACPASPPPPCPPAATQEAPETRLLWDLAVAETDDGMRYDRYLPCLAPSSLQIHRDHPLGEGGSGTVFLSTLDGSPVATKVLPLGDRDVPFCVAELQAQPLLRALLDGRPSNVMPVLGFRVDRASDGGGPELHMAMPLARGDLQSYMDSGADGAPPAMRAWRFVEVLKVGPLEGRAGGFGWGCVCVGGGECISECQQKRHVSSAQTGLITSRS